MPFDDERTPLLQSQEAGPSNYWDFGNDGIRDTDFHQQFCELVGIPYPHDPKKHAQPGPKTLYGRALSLKKSQGHVYQFTAGISNSLLLAQVILGAAVTALGASESSHVLITVFGAMNTIIAGVVAYLKSRGQPMRARMYRDDLERVVDEIENSEVMWMGISKHMHGYEDIDIFDKDVDKKVTVRSEVARLTRLYDRAVRNNTLNNPDMYMAASGLDQTSLALRARPAGAGQPGIPPVARGNVAAPAAAPVAVAAVDPDDSPATAPPKPSPPKEDVKKDNTPAAAPAAESSKGADKKPDPAPAKPADDPKAAASTSGSAAAPAPTPTPAPAPAAAPADAPAPAQDNLDDEPEPAAAAKP